MVALERVAYFMHPLAHINAEDLEPLFRHKVLSMLKKKRLITDRTIELISS